MNGYNMRRKLVAGNWKMYGSRASADALVQAILDDFPAHCDVAVFPPFPYLQPLIERHGGGKLGFGAQDCSEHKEGAYTGEVSATMLKDVGCGFVLAGHSERRQYHHESDAQIACKVVQALENKLTPVLCVGESLEEHDAGRTAEVVQRQLAKVIEHCGIEVFERVILAYEPVWAIGTGEVATPEDAQGCCSAIRGWVSARHGDEVAAGARILYGGSVKSDNMPAIMAQPDIDGGLVGGASLDAGEFVKICRYRELSAST